MASQLRCTSKSVLRYDGTSKSFTAVTAASTLNCHPHSHAVTATCASAVLPGAGRIEQDPLDLATDAIDVSLLYVRELYVRELSSHWWLAGGARDGGRCSCPFAGCHALLCLFRTAIPVQGNEEIQCSSSAFQWISAVILMPQWQTRCPDLPPQ